tara:strand:- start:842 stop:1819 length:978 start_codon:yes stop_codon:yes gene_type:complete
MTQGAEHYVHIMLIGEHVDHVYTAIEDANFHPKKRVYLIHSPDSKNTQFKKKASKVKKDIEKHSRTKVHLVQLSEKGAFTEEEIIQKISKIVKSEYPSKLGSPQQIAVNITGGTNMMAVGAMLAVASNKTSAYYVLDARFPENQNLATNLKEITVGFKIKEDHQKKHLQKILYQIQQSDFNWNGYNGQVFEQKYDHEAEREIKKRNIMARKSDPDAFLEPLPEPGFKIDSSFRNTTWMTPRTEPNAIVKKDLIEKFKTKKLGHVPAMTLSNRLDSLEEKGMIRIELGIPKLTEPKSKHRTFKIDTRQRLIILTPQGKAELSDYKP